MNACPGNNIFINYGTWYYPQDKSPSECTICAWCVNNGCFKASTLNKISHGIINYLIPINNKPHYSCDCENQSKHPTMIPFLCPTCKYKRCYSTCHASSGNCIRCNKEIATGCNKYCSGCSFLLKSCYACGDEITYGNEYIDSIKKLFSDKIDDLHSRSITENNGKCDEYYKEKIKIYLDDFWQTLDKYKDRSVEEISEIITTDM
jgi:hypothetical protein